jgi:threonine efflux protein
MHMALQLLAITGVLFLGIASPGPNFAMVTSTAMTVSRRAGLFAALGLGAASGTWTLAVVAGVGIILAHAPWIYTTIRIAGAAYLIWLGLKLLWEARKPMTPAQPSNASRSAAFRKAYLVSMTNPKSVAFYGSILTVMVPASAPAWFYAAIVGIAFVISAGWYCAMALLFSHSAARNLFARAKLYIESAMGLVLVGLGARMLAGR